MGDSIAEQAEYISRLVKRPRDNYMKYIAQGIFDIFFNLFILAWCYVPIYIYTHFIDRFLLEYHSNYWIKIALVVFFIIIYTVVIVKIIKFLYKKRHVPGGDSEAAVSYAFKKGRINKNKKNRKTKKLKEINLDNELKRISFIRNLSKKYKDVDSIYFNNGDEKSNKKIAKAIYYYAHDVKPRDVIVCFDDTMLGKSNQGFLLTNIGVYIKDSSNPLNILPWDKITEISFRGGNFNDSIAITVIGSIVVNICAETVIKKETQKIMEIILDVFNYYKKQKVICKIYPHLGNE